jgi:hypothetical protein
MLAEFTLPMSRYVLVVCKSGNILEPPEGGSDTEAESSITGAEREMLIYIFCSLTFGPP